METKKYKGGLRTLYDSLEIVEKNFGFKKNRILDIASDKPPRFASRIAKWYPQSEVTHFKEESIYINKIPRKYYNIKNLNIATSTKELQGKYNLAVAFFTLHEIRKPKRTLKKAVDFLDENGKMCIMDYDLTWFRDLSKKESWNKEKERENFSHIFTVGNEKKVLEEETNCINNHTKWGLEDYLKYCSDLNLTETKTISYNIKTPLGDKPKIFLYIGEKG